MIEIPCRRKVVLPEVNKVAFTGSTAVGKQIQRAVAGTDKRYTLELGGKAAHIIFEDAAIDQLIKANSQRVFGDPERFLKMLEPGRAEHCVADNQKGPPGPDQV